MHKITVLTICDRIAGFHTLYPFFTNTDSRWNFLYTSSALWCLEKDTNDTLIMVRQFIKPDYVDIDLLIKLRNKYKRLIFFHDDAGGGIPRLEALPFIDLWYQKALFKDKEIYLRSLYGKELYSDYFHSRDGIIDPDHKDRAIVINPQDLKKLRLSWNIGIGDYPRTTWNQRIAYKIAEKTSPAIFPFFYKHKKMNLNAVQKNMETISVHARLDLVPRPSIAQQRKLILEKIQNHPDFLVGMTSQKQYNKELVQSKIVLSPFGWGELCLRDFEAVRAGALLLKPDMNHIETWPNIFVDEKTYISFAWDGSDLIEKALYYLKNDSIRRVIAQNALLYYNNAINEIQDRFNLIMEEITCL